MVKTSLVIRPNCSTMWSSEGGGGSDGDHGDGDGERGG